MTWLAAKFERFHIYPRCKFENAKVLATLRFIIKALYKGQGENKNLAGELLSLDTLYEMVLSHSQFLDIFVGNDEKSEAKGKILANLLTSVWAIYFGCVVHF